ncbi:hypothetical protein MN608_04095 [Microdochium nivale]|nr:hypothetical protein MN608_04095 [Microdochium nivale]
MRPRLEASFLLSAAASLSSLTSADASAAEQSVIENGTKPSALAPSESAAWSRAPDIFNAVHNAMRQWGSSLNHNGMSFFIAHVPEGVLLHHGNDSPETPLGRPDWVAFEIEHAEQFTRPRGPIGKDLPGGFLHTYRTTKPMSFLYIDGTSAGKTAMGTLDTQDYILRDCKVNHARGLQNWPSHLHDKQGNVFDDSHIELKHRGIPTRPPTDSWQSRSKSKDEHKDHFHPHFSGEEQRAADICALCQEWGFQGAIRMEAGFEIIKCDFSDGLEQIQVLQRPRWKFGGTVFGHPPSNRPVSDRWTQRVNDDNYKGDPKLPPGDDGPEGDHRRAAFGGFGNLEYLRGLSERYNGIGSGRVVIDYSSMVSAFFFPVNMTNPDARRPDLPRLVETTPNDRNAIRTFLNRTIAERHGYLKGDAASQRLLVDASSVNWQGVSDMIVSRYADRIMFMAGEIDSLELMKEELEFLLTLFIDYSQATSQQQQNQQVVRQELDLEAATQRCTRLYLPNITSASSAATGRNSTEADRLLHVAFTRVSSVICKTLFHMFTAVTNATTTTSTTDQVERDHTNPNLDSGLRPLVVDGHSTTTATTSSGGSNIQRGQRWQRRREKAALARARSLAQGLVATLGWPRFKQCRPGCGLGEVCVVPMWPMGSVREYEAPRCSSEYDPIGGGPGGGGDDAGRRYWDGGPPPIPPMC